MPRQSIRDVAEEPRNAGESLVHGKMGHATLCQEVRDDSTDQ